MPNQSVDTTPLPAELDISTISRFEEAATAMKNMQRELNRLRPQAEAYQMLRRVIEMLHVPTMGYEEDPVQRIYRFLESRQPAKPELPRTTQINPDGPPETRSSISAEMDALIRELSSDGGVEEAK